MPGVLILASAVIATALGGCPKPAHHVKHKLDAPLCSCTFIEPRTVILQAPEAIPEPGELSVVRYYMPFTTTEEIVSYEPSQFDNWNYYTNWGYTGAVTTSREVTKCPELDPNSLGAGLTLLAGGIAVLRSGKRL